MNTFVVLKPEDAETLYITQDKDIALEILETSTSPLSWGEIEISEETEAVIALYIDEWIDMNDFKIPYKKTELGCEYDAITVDEFVIILRDFPDAASKLIDISEMRKHLVLMEEFPLLAAELEREVYEIFQQLPSQEDE